MREHSGQVLLGGALEPCVRGRGSRAGCSSGSIWAGCSWAGLSGRVFVGGAGCSLAGLLSWVFLLELSCRVILSGAVGPGAPAGALGPGCGWRSSRAWMLRLEHSGRELICGALAPGVLAGTLRSIALRLGSRARCSWERLGRVSVGGCWWVGLAMRGVALGEAQVHHSRTNTPSGEVWRVYGRT